MINETLADTIIDLFESFLDNRGIIVPNPARDEEPELDPEDSHNIFGDDRTELQNDIKTVLDNYNIEPKN